MGFDYTLDGLPAVSLRSILATRASVTDVPSCEVLIHSG
jgi:hypothetical protein